MMYCLYQIAIAVTLVAAYAAPAQTLTLQDYLGQVEAKNYGVAASKEAGRAAEARSAEADLLYSPQGFAQANYLNDQLGQITPVILGNAVTAESFKVGVQEQTSFGMKAKIYTGLDYVNLQGFNPSLIPTPVFHSGHQTLEVSQSILRNGFGSEVRAQERLVRSQSKAKSLGEAFKTKATLAQAEVSYWRLAATRDAVRVKEDSLQRANKIRDWNKRRDQLDLGKRSDVLQSDAFVKLAELDLQAAKDDERSAASTFNTARGEDSDSVGEAVETLDAEAALALTAPAKRGAREDVRAAEAAALAAKAGAEAAVEKNRPALDLTASVSMNGLDRDAGSAYSRSFTNPQPNTMLGAKLVVPLDFGLVSRVNGALRREAAAAQLTYENRKFEDGREWKDLSSKFGEAKHRLDLAVQIEEAQAEKYRNEKHRHDLGKTTTYQVLTFEQDYANAQLTRIKLHADVLQLVAQMKLYAGSEQ